MADTQTLSKSLPSASTTNTMASVTVSQSYLEDIESIFPRIDHYWVTGLFQVMSESHSGDNLFQRVVETISSAEVYPRVDDDESDNVTIVKMTLGNADSKKLKRKLEGIENIDSLSYTVPDKVRRQASTDGANNLPDYDDLVDEEEVCTPTGKGKNLLKEKSSGQMFKSSNRQRNGSDRTVLNETTSVAVSDTDDDLPSIAFPGQRNGSDRSVLNETSTVALGNTDDDLPSIAFRRQRKGSGKASRSTSTILATDENDYDTFSLEDNAGNFPSSRKPTEEEVDKVLSYNGNMQPSMSKASSVAVGDTDDELPSIAFCRQRNSSDRTPCSTTTNRASYVNDNDTFSLDVDMVLTSSYNENVQPSTSKTASSKMSTPSGDALDETDSVAMEDYEEELPSISLTSRNPKQKDITYNKETFNAPCDAGCSGDAPGTAEPTWVNLPPSSTPTTRQNECTLLPCDSCQQSVAMEKLVQCVDAHLTCGKCMEKIAKEAIKGKNRQFTVDCPVQDCGYSIPLAELRKIMPEFIVDAIEERIMQEALKEIEKAEGIVKCPRCDYMAELDAAVQVFDCAKCFKVFCRYCKEDFTDPSSHQDCKPGNHSATSDETIPTHWQTKDPSKRGYVKVTLDSSSAEHKQVAELFRAQMNMTIRSIERVENPRLWRCYSLHRDLMAQKNGIDGLNEMSLYHGTHPSIVDQICEQNFDFRLSVNANGTAYGRGTYFAKQAQYSHGYVIASRRRGGRGRTATALSFGGNVPVNPPPFQSPFNGNFVRMAGSGPPFGPPSQAQTINPAHIGTFAMPPLSFGSQPSTGVFGGQPPSGAFGVLSPSGAFGVPSSPATFGGQQPSGSFGVPPTSATFGGQPNPSHATDDLTGVCKLIMARVLIGKSTLGHHGMLRPPAINPADPGSELYDSCVDREHSPTIFVTFERWQSYPEYIISYYES